MNFITYLLMDISDLLANPLAVVGVAVAAVGLATVCIAKRITRAVRKSSKVDTSDKLYVSICTMGLIMILVALVIVSVASSQV